MAVSCMRNKNVQYNRYYRNSSVTVECGLGYGADTTFHWTYF